MTTIAMTPTADAPGTASGRAARLRHAILPGATLALVVLMVVPIPAFLLDIGFILNIMLSLAILMVALNVSRPLDFSAFPTILLFATLLRLSLNVASTRVVLMHGHEGPGAAGHVIESFGHFLIGGDYAVGLFVFAILMIINLVVITKGAGRVSEVSARFVLDAMPGKQMAIDSDLNAGLMTPEEAKARRQDVATEADFYGSMDGASKFVKGDAVAGVLILVINIVGGLVLGVVSHGLGLSEAASSYVLLAIGDALVAQVPALLLSIAAASIVTRVSSPYDLSQQVAGQFASSRAWGPVAAIITLIGLLPGMPHLLLLSAGGGAAVLAWRLRARERAAAVPVPVVAPPASPHIIDWHEISDGAAIDLQLGFGLVALVDDRRDAPLMTRITGIRRQLSLELGFVLPMVRVRDEMSLDPQRYRISIAGIAVGEGELWPDQLLAIDGDARVGEIKGRATKDPTYGLDALWIEADQRTEAVVAGYTVVDPATVIATHLNHIIQQCAADLFGIDEAQKLIDVLKEGAPQLVAALTPAPLPMAVIARIGRALLAEGIALKDFARIAAAMVDSAGGEADTAMLVERVRQRIGPQIVQGICPLGTPLNVVTLDSSLEGVLTQAVRSGPDATYPIEPGLGARLIEVMVDAAAPWMAQGRRFAVVTSPIARRALARLLAPHLPGVAVLSFLEIPDSKPVEVLAVVGENRMPPLIEQAA